MNPRGKQGFNRTFLYMTVRIAASIKEDYLELLTHRGMHIYIERERDQRGLTGHSRTRVKYQHGSNRNPRWDGKIKHALRS